VAVGPRPFPLAEEAVRAGGGEVVAAEDAEALVWMSSRHVSELVDVLGDAPGVRWVQLPMAGIERVVAAGVVSAERTWTCAKGLYSEPVAEMALALALAGLRQVTNSLRARAWGPEAGRTLYDGRVTIVGGGGITGALLDLLRPYRVATTVVRKRPEPVPGAGQTVGPERLVEVVGGADAVFLTLALTPDTAGIIGAPELEAMAPHAWLVNVARGGHVRTDDLVAALRSESIGGAGLDVTDPEPLPEGHPLWDLPNCIITPHQANTAAMAIPPLMRRIRDNVARFASGQPLEGVVDPSLGY